MLLMTEQQPEGRFNLKDPVHILACGFGLGLAKKAPGTWGTLAAFPFYFVLLQFPDWVYLLATAVMAVVGIWICGKTSEDMGVHDHGGIVWDEVVGMLITLFWVPVEWPWILAAFVAFRFFDILKPWPIRWLDKQVDGGFGIMIDDVIAGLFGLAVMHLALYYWY
ncbi:phosphatidylglycerophosphatase A [Corallincola holothuriorum]|uniref:Phosphatidylglycerophosphatase A n=1 Tax=Corallincola holothuriorum TaxID=2282215 RepID=A0A368N3Y3_9GAMM|nr:phosphatidylglycerophosphatase A [Corallincola holothuriorum]RCU45242.1 phosphatidylglycerophosphatase A [Corallincola holothuriorum]